MPYRLQPGSWQPARLRWIDHAILMVALVVIARPLVAHRQEA